MEREREGEEEEEGEGGEGRGGEGREGGGRERERAHFTSPYNTEAHTKYLQTYTVLIHGSW